MIIKCDNVINGYNANIYMYMCTDNYLSWKNVFTGESSHNKLGISLFGRYFEDNYYYLEDRIIKLN